MMTARDRSISPAVEDYTKAIHRLEARAGEPVSTNDLAGLLGVTAASVSGMLKKLDDLGLVTYVPYRGVQLSGDGHRMALAVIRRHRVIEAYLAEALGLSWDQVHDEAEVLEHAVSPELTELLAARIGHPPRDPHGDPIPSRDGRLEEPPAQRLDTASPGQNARLVRVSDRDPAVLRLLTTYGIRLGTDFEILERHANLDVVIRLAGVEHTLAPGTTAAMSVEIVAATAAGRPA